MDEEETEQQQTVNKREWRDGKPRTWTQRCTGQVSFTRFSAADSGGRLRILYSIHLGPGQEKAPQEVQEVFHAHKVNKDGKPTGLKLVNDRTHGKVWVLPNNPSGRAIADRLDLALLELGARLDNDRRQGR